jgi:hypothetical protein
MVPVVQLRLPVQPPPANCISALDYAEVDYEGTLQRKVAQPAGIRGDMEAFTPRVDLHYNLMAGPFTPFIMAAFGYSFIDTNIPNGRPSTGCWWDPWYGYNLHLGTAHPRSG